MVHKFPYIYQFRVRKQDKLCLHAASSAATHKSTDFIAHIWSTIPLVILPGITFTISLSAICISVLLKIKTQRKFCT